MRQTPCTWRRAWALYRSIQTTDSRGDPVRKYDMTSPDYTGEAGKASGVCWQITSDGIQVDASGERPARTAAFALYDSAVRSPHSTAAFLTAAHGRSRRCRVGQTTGM